MMGSRRRTPRYDRRDVPYRAKNENRFQSVLDLKLVISFFRRYVFKHKVRLFIYISIITIAGCAVYLNSFYGRIVVDDILVVTTEDVKSVASRATGSIRRLYDSAVASDRSERTSAVRDVDRRDSKYSTRRSDGVVSDEYKVKTGSKRPANALLLLLILYVLHIITDMLLVFGRRYAWLTRNAIARKIMGDVRVDVHNKIVGLSTSYLSTTTPGRLMARIVSDTEVLQNHLLNIVQDLIGQSIIVVVGAIIVFSIDWRCGLVVLLWLIPYSLIVRGFRFKIKLHVSESRHSNACLWGLASQKLDAMKAIFAYGRETVESANFLRLSAVLQRDNLQHQFISANVASLGHFVGAMLYRGLMLSCAYVVTNGEMSLGRMMFLTEAATQLFQPIIVITNVVTNLANVTAIVQRLEHILRNPNEIIDAPDAVDLPLPLKSGIDLEHVGFRYNENGRDVLSNITMHIPAGKRVCVMGPSGSGKSTLINLIARLYEPVEGQITFDGIPIDKIRQDSLHHHLSMVPQEAQIISGTVRSNIVYGRQNATPTMIMEAAEAADCHSFVMSLPVKYETIIGEKGSSLSGGQRQRISIARALLTKPDILVLDDCTSALDANTERKIQETLDREMRGKTCVIVSQRISMAVRCDYVVVLEDGHISERGTPAELAHSNGFYHRLLQLQTSHK